jgi:hypothetical protein
MEEFDAIGEQNERSMPLSQILDDDGQAMPMHAEKWFKSVSRSHSHASTRNA